MTSPPPAPWQRPAPGAPAPDAPLDRQFATFIGARWPSYRRKFTPFFEDARFQPTWNWAAALFSPLWFLYRKLYIPFVFFWIAPGIVFGLLWRGEPPQAAELATNGGIADDARILFLGVQLSAMILAGGTANFLLFRRAQAAIRLLGAMPATGNDHATPLLARVGGTNRVAVIVVLALMFVGVAMIRQGAAG